MSLDTLLYANPPHLQRLPEEGCGGRQDTGSAKEQSGAHLDACACASTWIVLSQDPPENRYAGLSSRNREHALHCQSACESVPALRVPVSRIRSYPDPEFTCFAVRSRVRVAVLMGCRAGGAARSCDSALVTMNILFTIHKDRHTWCALAVATKVQRSEQGGVNKA
jgi:hypothetical protein